MSNLLTTIKELINPNWVRHVSAPPLEAGLRPNQLLDQAEVVADGFEADDIALRGEDVFVSSGSGVYRLERGAHPRLVATLPGEVTALCGAGDRLIAAVADAGLVIVKDDGSHEVWSSDQRLTSCVTALSALPDGRVVAAVGSARLRHDKWSRALVERDRSGFVALVDPGQVHVLAEGVGWASGVAARGETELLLSASIEHRVDVIPVAGGRRKPLLRNLPAFPGRIVPHGAGWLVAFPYLRNRLSELLLEESDFVDEMVRTIPPDEWLVPSLRINNPYASALQLGQLRVLGVLKPWAPARTYGLVGVLDEPGRFSASFHSRVDGAQHGVTAAVRTPEGTLVAVRGSRNIVHVKESA